VSFSAPSKALDVYLHNHLVGNLTLGGVAFDSSGNAWSVTSANNTLDFIAKTGTGSTTYSGGGLNSPVVVAVDGAGHIWIANSGANTLSEFSNSGTAMSGTSGYFGSIYGAGDPFHTPSAIAIDNTGGIWVTNKSGNSVAHIFGAGTPGTTPLATAVTNGTVAMKP